MTDFYPGSGCNISEFIENLETSMEMGHSDQLGYINALGDLIDYRKYQRVTPQVLQNFSVVEMLIRRARRCISKKMRIQCNSELDIDSLEKRRHWATIEDLQAVIPFHVDHYKKTLDCCRKYPNSSPFKGSDICNKICRCLSISEGQRNTTNDLPISDSGYV